MYDGRSREAADRGGADRRGMGRDDRATERDRRVNADRLRDDVPSSDRGVRESRRVESRITKQTDERREPNTARIRTDKHRTAEGRSSRREERAGSMKDKVERDLGRSNQEKKERAPSPDAFDRWDGGLPDHIEVSN